MVKESEYDEAVEVFKDTDVKITKWGKKHLGAVVGQIEYRKESLADLVEYWVREINALSSVASHEPQSAYTAFTMSIRHRYTYFMRTIPDISELLKPLLNPKQISDEE